jgi:energy-coupling factor transport system ATP-binding protein
VEPLGADIQIQDVSVVLRTADGTTPVLHHLNLNIHAGEWVAIVGRNGSGKSTLSRVLAGLCPVSAGRVRIQVDGGSHTANPSPTPAPVVQMVWQNPDAQLVGETVYEDVCFGLENRAVPTDEMPQRAMGALRQVGLAALADRPVTTLSGGQKQLLCIAACLAMEPDVMVFDEATAMLDPASRKRVLTVVEDLQRRGTTIVWITQWLDELVRAQRVVALDGGQVVFDGTPTAFFYASPADQPSACEQLGFPPPYAVALAQRLIRDGRQVPGRPLSAGELVEVLERCR